MLKRFIPDQTTEKQSSNSTKVARRNGKRLEFKKGNVMTWQLK